MCGFVGFIGPGAPHHLALGAERVRRRGPDSMGVWHSADDCVRIHHARLAISDTRPVAAQPITDATTGQTVAFVGEIYNHLPLRGALPGLFQTDSDTETLLALFGRHWVHTFPLLRGMFALCVVDERRRQVLLARDPVGKKPLFILDRPEGVYFSSSVIALSAASGVIDLDDGAVAGWWERGFCAPRECLLKGARPVLPGEVLCLSFEGKILSTERLTPPAPALLSHIAHQDAVDEIERLLRQSVSRRLADNPNPVALLSGGIDSTVICKLAAESGTTRMLTLAVPIFKSSDEHYAKEAARRLGVQHETVMLSMSNTGVRVAEAIALQDEPLAIPSFIPLARLVNLAGNESRVLLTGDGGDEAFGGYGKPESWWEPGVHSPVEREFPCGPAYPEWMSDYGRRSAGFDLVGHGFTKLDRATAEQAVEARCPLLDWDVLAFVRSLPRETFFFKPGVSKPLLKALLHHWPDTFTERKKGGFTYRVRWLWSLSRYAGLREGIAPEAMARFRPRLPEELRGEPHKWQTRSIFKHFTLVFKLLVWSQFKRRLLEAHHQSPESAVDMSLVTTTPREANEARTNHAALPEGSHSFPDPQQLRHLKDTRFASHPAHIAEWLSWLSALGIEPNQGTLLDWGCGWGDRAWQLLAAGYRVTGYEPEARARGFAVSQMGISAYAKDSDLKGPFVALLAQVSSPVDWLDGQVMTTAARSVVPGGLLLLKLAHKLSPDDALLHRMFGLRAVLLTTTSVDPTDLRAWAQTPSPGITMQETHSAAPLLCVVKM